MHCVAIRHDASTYMYGRIVTDCIATHEKRIRVGRGLSSMLGDHVEKITQIHVLPSRTSVPIQRHAHVSPAGPGGRWPPGRYVAAAGSSRLPEW